MANRKTIATAAMVAAAIARLAGAPAQQSSAPSQKLDIMEVVGCLAEQPKGTWLVTNATEPVVSKTPYTNEESIKAAATRPLGTLTFGLIAISMFNPDAHRGHRVAVKGLLIKDPKGDRLNVTSLQMASATCP